MQDAGPALVTAFFEAKTILTEKEGDADGELWGGMLMNVFRALDQCKEAEKFEDALAENIKEELEGNGQVLTIEKMTELNLNIVPTAKAFWLAVSEQKEEGKKEMEQWCQILSACTGAENTEEGVTRFAAFTEGGLNVEDFL
ncbi:unnamed protein product [Amoebophrya sp. A120]|nr:unnamed protein product [Amoebophrya sp. A120]|eukprot:GSA120T00013617001.1